MEPIAIDTEKVFTNSKRLFKYERAPGLRGVWPLECPSGLAGVEFCVAFDLSEDGAISVVNSEEGIRVYTWPDIDPRLGFLDRKWFYVAFCYDAALAALADEPLPLLVCTKEMKRHHRHHRFINF